MGKFGWTLLAAAAACLGLAQDRLSFEVASVKPSPPGQTGCVMHPAPGGQHYVAICIPMKSIITTAYWLRAEQVIGGPAWMETDPFDIDGEASKPSTIGDLHLMMQNLLVERFNLKMHHETKELSAYVLSVDKNGPHNLTEHPPTYASDLSLQVNRDGLHEKWTAKSVPMAYFIWVLEAYADRAIVDQTGLKSAYDFDLAFDLEPPAPPPGAAPPVVTPLDASGPTMFQALPKQLGLKLEARKTGVDVLVIDHADRPTAN